MLNLVLYHPEIPANTGTIGRSCVLTGTKLHLIKPLGFSLDDKMIRRSGMGYWRDLDLEVHESYESFMQKYGSKQIWYCTKWADNSYHKVHYNEDDFLVFGSEGAGITYSILQANKDACIKIPMLHRQKTSPLTTLPGPESDPADPDAISLNLSNAANIVLFEALRQLDFAGITGDFSANPTSIYNNV